MKTSLLIMVFASLFMLGQYKATAQCTGGIYWATSFAPTCTNQLFAAYSGYYIEFPLTAGSTYLFSTCSADGGSSTFADTELTILNSSGVAQTNGYDDDGCGTTGGSSTITWTAPATATYRVLLNEYSCQGGAKSAVMAYRKVGETPVAQPTNLVFTNISTSGFNYTFSHSIPQADGYLHIRNTGSAPTFIPVNGTSYTQAQSLGGTTVVEYSDNVPSGPNPSNTVSPTTTYYYKIYAYMSDECNSNSRVYLTSSPLTGSVTTLSSSSLPTLTTTAASSIGQSTASSGGNISSDGGAAVTARGVVWNTSTMPTIALSTKTSNGTGTGTFTSTITGLAGSTTYYVRAYATNSVGTAYGSQITFTTIATQPTAQPTNLVFTSITTSSFTYSYTAASGSPDGYLVLRSSSGPVTGVPVDGVVYSNGTTLGNASVATSGTSLSWSASGLAPSTTYYTAVFSYNGSGTSINYLTTSPLTGNVTTLSPDSSPPTVTNTTPGTVAKNTGITFTVTATDAGSGVESVYVDYGKVENVKDIYDFNDSNISFIELTNSTGSTYSASIPATAVGEMGVVYYVYAFDNASNLYFDTTPRVITVVVDGNGIAIPYTNAGSSTSNYKLISVPLNLEKKTVNDVFSDDLGEYGDKSVWRMFRYQAGKNSELTGTSSIDAGKGYWLISSKSATIDSGPGTTFNGFFGAPATLSLTTGWNQIGNPYTFNLLWQDIVDRNSTMTLGALKTFSGGSFSNTSVLKSTEGAFVLVQAGGTLEFPLLKNPAAGRVGELQPKMNPIDSDNWEVLFNINNGPLVNAMGGIGMNKEAADLNDRFDDFTLPRFFDYLEINHRKRFVDIAYARDVVPVQENHIWEFDIESNLSDKIVQLTWDNSYFGANDKELVLWDETKQLAVDMRKVSVYHFDKNISKTFKVYYGNEAFISESVSTNGIVFQDIFPNPATDKVTFAFSLPNNGGDRNIDFEVYNLLGIKVGSVIEETYSPGYHEVLWHINDDGHTPGGMYLVKMKEGLFFQTRKLIIKH